MRLRVPKGFVHNRRLQNRSDPETWQTHPSVHITRMWTYTSLNNPFIIEILTNLTVILTFYWNNTLLTNILIFMDCQLKLLAWIISVTVFMYLKSCLNLCAVWISYHTFRWLWLCIFLQLLWTEHSSASFFILKLNEKTSICNLKVGSVTQIPENTRLLAYTAHGSLVTI